MRWVGRSDTVQQRQYADFLVAIGTLDLQALVFHTLAQILLVEKMWKTSA